MTGLMSRTTALFRVKANKVLDRAEDPEETLDYSYQRQVELLSQMKQSIAQVVTAKKRLQLQESKLDQSLTTLADQARQALAAGREDLARTALERKALIEGQVQGLDQQVSQLETQQAGLVDQERRLAAKVDAFRTQKEVIKANYSAAEAQVKIGEATAGLGEEMSDVGMAIQRAQDKTEQMQARAAAVGELVDSGALEDITSGGQTDLDRQIAALTSSSNVDDEMARMKAELSPPEPQPSLPPPADAATDGQKP